MKTRITIVVLAIVLAMVNIPILAQNDTPPDPGNNGGTNTVAPPGGDSNTGGGAPPNTDPCVTPTPTPSPTPTPVPTPASVNGISAKQESDAIVVSYTVKGDEHWVALRVDALDAERHTHVGTNTPYTLTSFGEYAFVVGTSYEVWVGYYNKNVWGGWTKGPTITYIAPTPTPTPVYGNGDTTNPPNPNGDDYGNGGSTNPPNGNGDNGGTGPPPDGN